MQYSFASDLRVLFAYISLDYTSFRLLIWTLDFLTEYKLSSDGTWSSNSLTLQNPQ